jgi:NAD(P)-dependent dehydrogenase (short-subunit alcohol dehydrogenase family)
MEPKVIFITGGSTDLGRALAGCHAALKCRIHACLFSILSGI